MNADLSTKQADSAALNLAAADNKESRETRFQDVENGCAYGEARR